MTNGSNHLKQKSLFSLKDQTVVWGFFVLCRSYSDAEGKRFSYINIGESIENDCSALKSWQILFVVLTKVVIHEGFEIKFQFVDRLDCEVQTEDRGGQAGTNESGKEVHLLAE